MTPIWLACARDGDLTAWEELFRRYDRLMRSTLSSFRLQPADADEAVQNTWLRVMERMSTIRDPERLGGWLATTASLECCALIRRKQLLTSDEGPDVALVAGETHRAVDTAKLIRRVFYDAQVARATGMPTPRRVWRELPQSGAHVAEDVKGEPTEGTEQEVIFSTIFLIKRSKHYGRGSNPRLRTS